MLRQRTPFRVSGASVIAQAPVSGVSTEGSEAADIAMRGELRDHPGNASRQGAQKDRRDPTRQAVRRTQSPARGARLGSVAAVHEGMWTRYGSAWSELNSSLPPSQPASAARLAGLQQTR